MPIEIDYLTDSPALELDPGPPDGTYLLNEQHTEQAINHLIEAFRGGPRNRAFLSVFGAQIQELEQAIWSGHKGFQFDSAVGDQLDLLGLLVGELRQGRDDDDYRAAVRVRLKVNASDGTWPTLLTIAEMMVPTATIVATEPTYAFAQIDFSNVTGTTLRTVAQMLRLAHAGGVRLIVSAGGGVVGSEDGAPAGGLLGSEDGDPAGFSLGSEV